MKIRPLDDRVVVEPIEAEEKTAGGIVLPDTAKEKPQRGRVISVGPGLGVIPTRRPGVSSVVEHPDRLIRIAGATDVEPWREVLSGSRTLRIPRADRAEFVGWLVRGGAPPRLRFAEGTGWESASELTPVIRFAAPEGRTVTAQVRWRYGAVEFRYAQVTAATTWSGTVRRMNVPSLRACSPTTAG